MRFAKAQEKKMGRPEGEVNVKKREPQKSPISKIWISTFVPFPRFWRNTYNTRRERERGIGVFGPLLLDL
jgi:hypothetical protein